MNLSGLRIEAVTIMFMNLPGFIPAWRRCKHCEEFWCLRHGKHVSECDCRPIEEWPFSPYVH